MSDEDQSGGGLRERILHGPTLGWFNDPKGNTSPPGGVSGNVQYNNAGTFGGLTDAELTEHIGLFSATLAGVVPASGSGLTKFLRQDGQWVVPSGGGGGGGSSFISPQDFGAVADGNSHKISQADIDAHPEWIGPSFQAPHTTWPVGTEIDTVGLQEAVYAAFAPTSTPGNVVWTHETSNYKLNQRLFIPHGRYLLNRQVFIAATAFEIEFESRYGAMLRWRGYDNLVSGVDYPPNTFRGTVASGSAVVTGIAAADVAQLHVDMFVREASLDLTYGKIKTNSKIVSIDSATQITLSKTATGNGAIDIYPWTSALRCDAVAYGVMRGLSMICDVPLPATSYSSFSGAGLLHFDHFDTAGLSSQQLSFYDFLLFGNGLSEVGMAVNPDGASGAQFDTVNFLNFNVQGCSQAGAQIVGANALSIRFEGGAIGGCLKDGIRTYGASVFVDGMTTTNQRFNFFTAPWHTQISGDGFDYNVQGVGGNSNPCVKNIRSEGNRGAKMIGGICENVGLSGLDIADTWTALNADQIGSIHMSTVNNAKKRSFFKVSCGADDNWHQVTTGGAADTIVLTDNPAYGVNSLVGALLWCRLGSSGFAFTLGSLISANTANTITIAGETPDKSYDTTYLVAFEQAGVEPNWDTAANGAYDEGVNTGGGYGIVAGSNIVKTNNVLSVNDYIIIPNGDIVSVFNITNGQQTFALVAKVTAVDYSTPGFGFVTINKTAKYTAGDPWNDIGIPGYSGTPIADSTSKWLQIPWSLFQGMDDLVESFGVGGQIRDVRNVHNSRLPSQYSALFGALTEARINGELLDPANANEHVSLLSGPMLKRLTVLGTGAATNISSSMQTSDYMTLTPTQNMTLNITSTPPPYTQEITILILTSGAVSFNVTFGTNFVSSGVLATGAVDSKRFVVKFICDGLKYVETSRTGPL